MGEILAPPDTSTAETGIPVTVAEDPLLSVAYGTGKLLGDARLLSRLSCQ